MNPKAIISVVQGVDRQTVSYRLLDGPDRLVAGDAWVSIGKGNMPEVVPIDRTWLGTLVMECPEGVYLRPVASQKT